MPETNEVAVEQGTEVKVKSTVVDIDSVREEVKQENLGLLDAAEQEDGKWSPKGTSACVAQRGKD